MNQAADSRLNAPSKLSARKIRLAMLFILACTLLWALVESLGGEISGGHNALQVVWVRYLTHIVLLVALFAPRRGTAIVATARPHLQIVRGSLMLVMPACFLLALRYSSVSDVLSVFWAVPLLTMVFAAWLLKERIERWHWLAGFAGWLGVLLLLRPDAGVFGIGMLPAIGMATSMSLYLVFTRQLRDESTLTNLVFTAACVLVPLSVVMPGVWTMPSPTALGMMAAIGVLGLGLLYALDRATELAPVSHTAPVLYIQPVWMLLIAVLAGSAHPGRANLLGSMIVITTCLAFALLSGIAVGGAGPDSQAGMMDQSGVRQMGART